MSIFTKILIAVVWVVFGLRGAVTRIHLPTSPGAPNVVAIKPPSGLSASQRATFVAGEVVVGQSGCLACHLIGGSGNNGPGPPLTHIGTRLRPAAISYELRHPTAPMPSFANLAHSSPKEFSALVQFLSLLK